MVELAVEQGSIVTPEDQVPDALKEAKMSQVSGNLPRFDGELGKALKNPAAVGSIIAIQDDDSRVQDDRHVAMIEIQNRQFIIYAPVHVQVHSAK